MIKIVQETGSLLYIQYYGSYYSEFLEHISGKSEYDGKTNSWIIDKNNIPKILNVSYNTIANSLKLNLFKYQQQVVYEALSTNGNCLIKLPCGSGKDKFIYLLYMIIENIRNI